MPLMRGYGCSGVVGDQLYVMGGGNSHEWLGDCQRLDLRTGRWSAVSDAPPASMPHRRAEGRGHQAAAGWYARALAAACLSAATPTGPGPHHSAHLRVAPTPRPYTRCHQPKHAPTHPWAQGPTMSKLRGCAGAASLGNRLYVAGGGMADVQYDTVEIFNPEINAWMPGGAPRAAWAPR